jgi:hypothetical protein
MSSSSLVNQTSSREGAGAVGYDHTFHGIERPWMQNSRQETDRSHGYLSRDTEGHNSLKDAANPFTRWLQQSTKEDPWNAIGAVPVSNTAAADLGSSEMTIPAVARHLDRIVKVASEVGEIVEIVWCMVVGSHEKGTLWIYELTQRWIIRKRCWSG